MAPKKKIVVPTAVAGREPDTAVAGREPDKQEPWVPERAQDIRTISNWVIKMVRLAGTGDQLAIDWALQQGFAEDKLMPESIALPQYVHRDAPGETHLGAFNPELRLVVFEWRKFWDNIAQWRLSEPGVRGIRASGPDTPDGCFCMHDGRPDPRVGGANKYFLVFFWDEPEGLLLGVRCDASGGKPSFKAPFESEASFTWRTGVRAQTSTHFTSGPDANPGGGGRPAGQTRLPCGPQPQQGVPMPVASFEDAQYIYAEEILGLRASGPEIAHTVPKAKTQRDAPPQHSQSEAQPKMQPEAPSNFGSTPAQVAQTAPWQHQHGSESRLIIVRLSNVRVCKFDRLPIRVWIVCVRHI